MKNRSILIQNYHAPATTALIRDFKKIGFQVFSPDNDWGRLSWYSPNDGLGGALVSQEEYFRREPGYVLITCKPQEESLKAIAREHGDRMILNVAQQYQFYEPGISDVMICPDIMTYNAYPSEVRHKLLYFFRPQVNIQSNKDVIASFERKHVYSFISSPRLWPQGTPAFERFRQLYPHPCEMYGYETTGGHLDHDSCNIKMAEAFFTVHFKELEAYGLSCLESMMLGTPIVSLNHFMQNKTLGTYFLDDTNAIVDETVEGAVKRLSRLSLHEYERLSQNARARVLDLTADDKTVQKLKQAICAAERNCGRKIS